MILNWLHIFITLITDSGLTPFTEYHYSIQAVNGAGIGSSEYSKATTSQTLPEGVTPPLAKTEPGVLDTIYLEWDPPAAANGQ